MRTLIKGLSIGLLALVIAACGEALTPPTTFEVVLDGEQAGVDTAAFATANVSAVGNVVTIAGSWDAPEGTVITSAGVYGPADEGEPGALLHTLGIDSEDKTFGGTFTLDPERLAHFEDGRLYLALNADGEPLLRGQITR